MNNSYIVKHRMREATKSMGTVMKQSHTIVEKWPFRMKLQPGQPVTQAEFDQCLAIGVTGKERYIEWKRIQHVAN